MIAFRVHICLLWNQKLTFNWWKTWFFGRNETTMQWSSFLVIYLSRGKQVTGIWSIYYWHVFLPNAPLPINFLYKECMYTTNIYQSSTQRDYYLAMTGTDWAASPTQFPIQTDGRIIPLTPRISFPGFWSVLHCHHHQQNNKIMLFSSSWTGKQSKNWQAYAIPCDAI